MIVDLAPTIVPKSDQLNADDLIGQTLTILVTKVSLCGEADQPIAVHYDGDNGRPYKPCKSMRRVLRNVWGRDGNAFVGRRMTLYRDDKVQFGGLAVGGIRISHMSDIDRDVTMALTMTRANRKPFTVKPLAAEQGRRTQTNPTEANGGERQPSADSAGFPGDRDRAPEQPKLDAPTLAQRTAAFRTRFKEAPNTTKLRAIWAASQQLREDLDRSDPEELAAVTAEFEAWRDELEEAERASS